MEKVAKVGLDILVGALAFGSVVGFIYLIGWLADPGEKDTNLRLSFGFAICLMVAVALLAFGAVGSCILQVMSR